MTEKPINYDDEYKEQFNAIKVFFKKSEFDKKQGAFKNTFYVKKLRYDFANNEYYNIYKILKPEEEMYKCLKYLIKENMVDVIIPSDESFLKEWEN